MPQNQPDSSNPTVFDRRSWIPDKRPRIRSVDSYIEDRKHEYFNICPEARQEDFKPPLAAAILTSDSPLGLSDFFGPPGAASVFQNPERISRAEPLVVLKSKATLLLPPKRILSRHRPKSCVLIKTPA